MLGFFLRLNDGDLGQVLWTIHQELIERLLVFDVDTVVSQLVRECEAALDLEHFFDHVADDLELDGMNLLKLHLLAHVDEGRPVEPVVMNLVTMSDDDVV